MSEISVMKTFRKRFLLWLICLIGAMFLVNYEVGHATPGTSGLIILGLLFPTGFVVALVFIIRKSQREALAAAPPPGAPIDEATRKQRLRYIRVGKITIAVLASVLLFSLFQGFPFWALLAGAFINLACIAVLLQVVVRLQKSLR